MSLGRKSNDVCSTINKAVAAYEQGFTPREPEAQMLLAAMTEVIEVTETQLSLLEGAKPVFDKLWVAGLVKKNTASLGVASAKLSEVMSQVAPEHMKAESQELEDRRRVAFDKVLAVYGNVKDGEKEKGQDVQ
ncbi:hypothetical protein NHQ30_008228 [Ciborinia camelliae]|nr:hypothetical protein NHQ30_008228 [Ciborinia camelliae]